MLPTINAARREVPPARMEGNVEIGVVGADRRDHLVGAGLETVEIDLR
jgi:hypothetical protein